MNGCEGLCVNESEKLARNSARIHVKWSLQSAGNYWSVLYLAPVAFCFFGMSFNALIKSDSYLRPHAISNRKGGMAAPF